MTVKKLEKIFNPDSIAVVGASDNKGSVGYGVFKNLSKGYSGKLYAVNNKHSKVQGKKAFKSILKIKDSVDLAVIATPSSTVIRVFKECCKKGVRAAVVMASGFSEGGRKGRFRSRELLRIARDNKVRVIGPNCMGFINPHTGLNSSFARAVPHKGNIAFISQSGALGSATLDLAIEQNLGLSFFASIGSMIDVSFSELIDYLGNDPNTESIVIYMESLKYARKFISAARAFSRDKPIIVLKSGKSLEGARAALSHTGSLAGNDDAFNAAFRRAGVVRVNETDDLFDCAKTLSKQERPRGNRLAIVSNAGGPGVLSTDVLVERGGELANLSKFTVNKLNRILPSAWSKGNPVDLLGDADAVLYKKAIEACIHDPGVDGVLVLLTPQTMTDSEKIAKAIVSIKSDKPILSSFMGGDSVVKGRDILEKGGIPSFPYPERAVKSFIYLYDYSRNIKDLYETPGSIPHAFNPNLDSSREIIYGAIDKGRFVLSDEEARNLLENYEIPVSKGGVVSNSREAVKLAKKIGFPVALKIASPDVLHKTEARAVKLNVCKEKDVRKCFNEIVRSVKINFPKADIKGVIVSEMANKRYELIIGCKKDSIFGPCIVFGMGGVSVNVFNDVQVGLPPLNMKLAKNLIEGTKISSLLKGYRNVPGVDIDSLAFVLYKFAYLVSDFPEIKEIDINPFSVDERGGVVLDVKVILDSKSFKKSKLYSHLVISPYPKDIFRKVKMKGGKSAILRPIRPEDEPLEAELFKHFSKRTQRMRFFGLVKDVNHEMLVRYTHNDYDRELGIMAEVVEGGKKKMVGVVRMVSNSYDNSAEFAIVVADPWQKKGLGSKMTDYMLEVAKSRGIKKIYACFLKDNNVMKKMFLERGFSVESEDDMFFAEKELTK